MNHDYPLVRVEKEWLEAVEELNDFNPDLYRLFLSTAIRRAAGENESSPLNEFFDEVLGRYWAMTGITVADKKTHRPGLIELLKHK